MVVISSLKNPTIKQIRALRRRSERERNGLFYVEGLRSCRAAIESIVETAWRWHQSHPNGYDD